MISRKINLFYWIFSFVFLYILFYSIEVNYITYDFNIGLINKKINIYFFYVFIALFFYFYFFILSFSSKETYLIFLVVTLTLSRQIPLFLHFIILIFILIFVFIININKFNILAFLSKKTLIYLLIFLLIQLFSTILSGSNLISFRSIAQQIIFLFVVYTIFLSLRMFKRTAFVFYPGYIIGSIICFDYSIHVFLDYIITSNLSLFQRNDLFFFNSPTAIGLSLSICIFIVFLKLLTHRRTLFDFFCLLYFFLILFFCGSRESLLFVFLFVLFLIFNKKLYLNFLFLFFFFISVIAVYIFSDFFISSLRLDNLLSGREYIWAVSIDLITSNLFFGIGPDLYSSFLIQNFGNSWDLRGAISGNGSHNIILDILLTGGVILLFQFFNLSLYYLKKLKSVNNIFSIYIKYFFFCYLIVAQFGSRGLIGGGLGEGVLIWYLITLGVSENKIFNKTIS